MNPDIVAGRGNESLLTPYGIQQAKSLGRYLSVNRITPSKVFSSPAIRTMQTAKYLLDAMGMKNISITEMDALQEMDQGEWVGRLRKETYTPATIAEIERLGKDFRAPGGESMNDVGQRMLEWLNIAVAGQDITGRLFVVSHGVAIRCLISTLLNWSQAETYHAITNNTSLTLLTSRGKQWQVKCVGANPN